MITVELVKKYTKIKEHGAVEENWEVVSKDRFLGRETVQCTITRNFDPVAAAYGSSEYGVYDVVNKECSFSVKELLHIKEIIESMKINYSDLRAISDIWNQTKTPVEIKKFPFSKA